MNRLGSERHKSASDVLAEALDSYEQLLFWEQYARAAAALAADPTAAAAEAAEIALWDRTSADGLADA